MDFRGKNVVVLGGSGGIGFEVCRNLLKKEISNLGIFDIQMNSTALATLRQEFPQTKRMEFLKMDITKKSEIENCFKKIIDEFKYIDILINCCGLVQDDKPDMVLDVNLLGLINTSLIALEYMGKNKGGKGGTIVNVASVFGLEPSPSIAVYTAAKHGVIGWTRSVGCDFYYNITGVKHIAICPGITETNLITNFEKQVVFPYSVPLCEKFYSVKRQTAVECGVNFVKAIEQAKNGSIWICDLGKTQEVIPTKYWELQFN